jgi:Tol biopolymer transport system component
MYSFAAGSRVAYVSTDGSGSTLIARDVNRGPAVTLMAPPSLDSIGDFAWLPDGRFIYSDNCGSVLVRFDTPCSIWIERFDIRSGALTERARRLTKVLGASISNPSATVDGRRVAFLQSRGYGTAYVAELGVGATSIRNTVHFTLDEGDDAITDWTPDSHTAIIVRNRGDHSAVYKQALDSEVAEPIVANLDQGLLGYTILSPDSKWIILQVWPLPPPPNMAPRTQIWRVPIGGGALRELFSLAPGSTISCARAPATLCVTAEPTADRKQAIVAPFDPATGLRGTELLRFDRYPNPNEDAGPLAFALSPNGRWVSTSAAPAGPLRILSLEGGPTRELSVKGLNVKGQVAAWTPDGRGLIVTTYREDAAMLLHVDLQGNAHELFKCESAQMCFGIPSPDGSRLGIYQIRTAANIWMLDNS